MPLVTPEEVVPESEGRPEQRRQIRFAISQQARLAVGERTDIACEIQDFCLGGLYLHISASDDARYAARFEGQVLQVAFTPPASISPRAYEITATLVRCTSNGAGVAFREAPLDAIRVLQKVAFAARAQRVVANLHPERGSEAIREAAQALLSDAMEVAIQHFGNVIPGKLSAVPVSAESLAEHNVLLRAARDIDLNFPRVREAFQQGILAAVRKLESGQLAAEAPADADELSIVDKDEFEDWLNATSEAGKLEERYQFQLNTLEPRLEQLYGCALDAGVNPYGPTAQFRVFMTALESVIPLGKVRSIAYLTLREGMQEPLGTLYQKLDEILPKASEPVFKSKFRHDARAPGSGAAQQDSPITLGIMTQALMGLLRRNAPAAPSVPVGVSASPGSAGIMTNAVLPYAAKVLQELVNAGAIPAGREAEVQGSVDVFGALVSAMDAERSIPDQIRPFFKRLEEPLLKLAIQDASFFNSPRHPAQRALNAIDRLSMVSSDHGQVKDENLLKLINRWTERIRAEAATNPGIYDEARAQLEKVLEPLLRARLARIARLQEALEGWQKTSQAKRSVTRSIEERVQGKPVPTVVLDLLNTGWRNYLTRVLLRKPQDDDEKLHAWQALDQLLDWLGADSEAEISRDQAHHLLQYLDTHLALVSADRDEQERVIDRLAEHLLYAGDRSKLTYTNLKPASANDAGATELSGEASSQLGGIQVGDWFIAEKFPEPLNLVWIGDDPELYVFANYRGVKKFDAKPRDFAAMLADGSFKHTDSLQLPLFDRSLSSMVQHMHRSLMRQAVLDPVTGIIRQKEFMRRVRHAWLRAGTGDFGFAIGVMDIEDLRLYQAQLDDEGRDTLLLKLAEYLKTRLPDPELFARSGERIFAFMLKADDHEAALDQAEQLITQVNKFNFVWKGERYPLTANIGLAWSVDCLDPDGLYAKADEACISSKHAGRNQLVMHREDEQAQGQESGLVYWASHINSVLADGHLTLRCQPILPIGNVTGDPAHFEILLGTLAGFEESFDIGEFVASVERLKRGSELDRWVLEAVFAWIRRHPEEFENIGSFAINISGQSLGSKAFFDFVVAELGKGDIPGHKLIFEITEGAAIDSFAHAQEFVRHLRRYGCRFSLDDFGVGFSSYSSLKKLKVDYLKIDGSFVRDMLRNEVDVALVSSMNETSRFLGIKTIAESVENEETLDKLREIGVDYVQGFHTGRPLLIDELLKAA
ncbi:MAG TPA: DUF1631 family protein [Thiobacillaceae bacterium]|nr:DUF1631 family protein [Thiobacillaceae bacterium]